MCMQSAWINSPKAVNPLHAHSDMSPVIAIRDLEITKRKATAQFRLRVPKLQLVLGEQLAILGRSGSGKSTLLDSLALIIKPDSIRQFTLTLPGYDVIAVDALLTAQRLDELATIRARALGYVLQTGGLLPYIPVEQNILLPIRLHGLIDQAARSRLRELAERLEITQHLGKLPGDLSVGERQRVAIARALANRPALILADEPTAALDPVNGNNVLRLLIEATQAQQSALVIASHDRDLIEQFGLDSIEARLQQDHDNSVTATFQT